MNTRINDLIMQSYVTVRTPSGEDYTYFSQEKFAELIVRECANRASWAQDTGEKDIGGEVLKHFGVEE